MFTFLIVLHIVDSIYFAPYWRKVSQKSGEVKAAGRAATRIVARTVGIYGHCPGGHAHTNYKLKKKIKRKNIKKKNGQLGYMGSARVVMLTPTKN